MCGALTTSSPWASSRAHEKSRRSLTLVDSAVRRSCSPISRATAAKRWVNSSSRAASGVAIEGRKWPALGADGQELGLLRPPAQQDQRAVVLHRRATRELGEPLVEALGELIDRLLAAPREVVAQALDPELFTADVLALGDAVGIDHQQVAGPKLLGLGPEAGLRDDADHRPGGGQLAQALGAQDERRIVPGVDIGEGVRVEVELAVEGGHELLRWRVLAQHLRSEERRVG